MAKNKDGFAKNIAVVTDEFEDFWDDQKWNFSRFIKFKLDPKDDDNMLHVGVAFISTFWQSFPRTLTYLTIGYGVYCALRALLPLVG